MSDLRLTLACEDYDRTRALRDGAVKPEGIDLNYLVLPVEEIFWRMLKYNDFDVAELSMGAFFVAAAQGVVVQAELRHHPCREVLDHDVGTGHQIPEEALALRRLEIEGQ